MLVQRLFKFSSFRLALIKTRYGLAPIVSNRTTVSMEDEITPLMYARLEVFKRITMLSEKADKNLKVFNLATKCIMLATFTFLQPSKFAIESK